MTGTDGDGSNESGGAVGFVETFDHTADVGLRVGAPTWAALLRVSAEGVMDYVVANRSEIEPREEIPIAVEGPADDPAEVLAAWLGEVLFRSETGHRVFREVAIARADDPSTWAAGGSPVVEGAARGEPIDPTRHVLDHEVKAVTRHGLSLRRLDPGEEPRLPDGGYVAEFILDI